MNDRAQLLVDGLPQIVLTVIVAAFLIVGYNTMSTSMPAVSGDEYRTVCNGLFGCGAAPAWWVALMGSLLAMVLVFTIALHVFQWPEDEQ